jgi:phage baseplate assembly protein gpV
MTASIAIEWGIYSAQYKTKQIILRSLMVSNKINQIPHGTLWIMAQSNYNFLNNNIAITINNITFKFLVQSQEHHIHSQQPGFPYLIKINLQDGLWSLTQEIHCKTWNNLSNKDVINKLLNGCKILQYQWGLPIIKKPIFIQYNQSNWQLFSRIISESQGLFFFDGQWNIVKNLPSKNPLNNSQEAIIKNQKDYNINLMNYDRQQMGQCSQQKGFTTNIIKGQYTQNFYENYHYEYPITQWISSHLWLGLGDFWQDNIIIGNEYEWQFHQDLNVTSGNGIELATSSATNTIFTAPKNSLLWPSIKREPVGFLTAFVQSIENKYYNNQGGVLIKFPWDVNPEGEPVLANGCWVPTSQLLAGNNYYSWFMPQPGQEVIVGFLNNNVDEPCVLGSLYNKLNTAPSFGSSEIALKTSQNSIIIDDQQKHLTLVGENNLNTTLKGSYNFSMEGDGQQSYNITLANGAVNIALNNGNYNFNINGHVNFNIKGDLNFSVDKNINLKCQNFNVDNNETQWNDKTRTITTNIYKFKANAMTQETISHVEKTTQYDHQSTTMKFNTTALNLSATQLDVASQMAAINSPLLNMDANILTMKSTVATIKADSMLMLQSSTLVQIMAGLFNVLPTISFVIRGPIGNVGSVPPLLS